MVQSANAEYLEQEDEQLGCNEQRERWRQRCSHMPGVRADVSTPRWPGRASPNRARSRGREADSPCNREARYPKDGDERSAQRRRLGGKSPQIRSAARCEQLPHESIEQG